VDVSVVARHMEVTDAMRSYVREKVAKLPRFYDGLHSTNVTLALDAGEHLVEIVAHGRRKSVFVASQAGKDLYACVDQCAHKLEEQLRRHKDRVRDRHGPPHEETMTLEEPPEG
jgi:putative sigma-54 modulation protein